MFIYNNGPDVNTLTDILFPVTDLNGDQTPVFAVHIESRLRTRTNMLLHLHQVLLVVYPAAPALRIRQAEAKFSLSGSAGHYSLAVVQAQGESSGDARPSTSWIRDGIHQEAGANLEL
jgi:hypothetical protein